MQAVRALLLALLALAHGPARAAETEGRLVLRPPAIDVGTVCARNRIPLGTDWARWDGRDTRRSTADLLALAAELASGSDRIAANLDAAERLLRFLAERRKVGRGALSLLKGRIGLRRGGMRIAEAERDLLRAVEAGEPRAALELARLHDGGSHPAGRDPALAARYFAIAAAAGEPDGQLGLARLAAQDPQRTPAERRFLARSALFGAERAIRAGRCGLLRTLGEMHLSGDLVANDPRLAADWLELAASAGDAAAADLLGTLLLSSRLGEPDPARALRHLEAAAERGRPAAALLVGKAYAAGIGRPRDLARAARHLATAGEGGLAAGHAVLARLHDGAFGGPADPERAVERGRRAVARPDATAEDVTAQAGRLLRLARMEDLATLAPLLERHALRGDAEAARLLGEWHLARRPGEPQLARRFLHLAAGNGSPQAALRLARLTRCSSAGGDETAWLERAAALGSGHALVRMAEAEADPGRARRLLEKAAFADVPEAMGRLVAARAEPSDPGLPQRLLGRLPFLHDEGRRAADLAVLEARLTQAPSRGERATLLRALRLRAEAGSAAAQMLHARRLAADDTASGADVEQALRLAAETGEGASLRRYALRLQKDPAQAAAAAEVLRRAAHAGDALATLALVDPAAPGAEAELARIGASGTVCSAEAMVALAKAHRRTGQDEGRHEARRWLDRAADIAIEGPALRAVAEAMLAPDADPADLMPAKALLIRAAAAGDAPAMRRLAQGHLVGLWPDASTEAAGPLLLDAARHGDNRARTLLAQAVASGRIALTGAALGEALRFAAGLPDLDAATAVKLAHLSEAGPHAPPDAARTATLLARAARPDKGGRVRGP